MQNVMRWTELVVEGLQSVKWKVAGYAPKTSEGSSNEANLEAPVYTISNPNAVLDRLTNMYSFIPFHDPSLFWRLLSFHSPLITPFFPCFFLFLTSAFLRYKTRIVHDLEAVYRAITQAAVLPPSADLSATTATTPTTTTALHGSEAEVHFVLATLTYASPSLTLLGVPAFNKSYQLVQCVEYMKYCNFFVFIVLLIGWFLQRERRNFIRGCRDSIYSSFFFGCLCLRYRKHKDSRSCRCREQSTQSVGSE